MVQKKSRGGVLLSVEYALIALLIAAFSASSATFDKSTSGFWQSQFNDLSGQIAAHRSLAKTSVVDNAKVLDHNALILDTDRDPTDVVVRRTEAMLADLSKSKGKADWKAFASRLDALKQAHSSQRTGLGKTAISVPASSDSIYFAAQALNREIMLAAPTLDFTDLLFIERGTLATYAGDLNDEFSGNHMCDQYFGQNALTGGGMFILKNFATSPQKVNIMTGLTVPSGTNKGKLMTDGTFLAPDLSYDGKTIVFCWSSGGHDKWKPENRFNIFTMNVDGTNLKRLTDGDYDDILPCWLPSGRIVFSSTRRGGYGRCHQRPVPTFTLHSMKADGSDLICISYHETNEWHPSVTNDGRILFTRWDYVDRDANIAQQLWFCNPDGTNPRSWGGNYPTPLSTIGATGSAPDGRNDRPFAEYNGHAIPGSSKFVATAGPHHGQSFGSLVIFDFDIPDDNKMAQVTRLTPDAPMAESQTGWHEWYHYGTPWPLSESSYLCNYDYSLLLLDKSGSKQELYKRGSTPKDMRPIYPIPLRPRTKPTEIAVTTYQGERWNPQAPKATLNVLNVNITDDFGKLPTGVKIKSMRIMEVLSKTTPLYEVPKIGYAQADNARMPLGTVPVESDGSVKCEAPIGKPIYFQLLDENGMAVQSMRSATFVHPGEQLTCTGCHEDKWKATPVSPMTIASQREPSKITPEAGGVEPVNFYRIVKPIFDSKCQTCHTQSNNGPRDMSYGALKQYAFFFGDGYCMDPNTGGSRVKPGQFGARYCRMGKAMLSTTHQQAITNGKFTPDDMRRVTLWLDSDSPELGVYEDVDLQRKGQLVWPRLDADPQDPQGLNYLAPAMGEKGLWVKVNDGNSAIAYSSGWSANSSAGYDAVSYASTNHFSSNSGATATFSFTGVGARFYGFQRNDLGIVQVLVDGTQKANIDCYSADNGYDLQLYQITGLTNGDHTIQIKVSGSKNGASKGTGAVVNAFSYLKPDVVKAGISQKADMPRFMLMIQPLGCPISLPSNFAGKPLTIKILNLAGRLVQRIAVNEHEVVAPVSQGVIGRGIYIVNCRAGNLMSTQKIMKVR